MFDISSYECWTPHIHYICIFKLNCFFFSPYSLSLRCSNIFSMIKLILHSSTNMNSICWYCKSITITLVIFSISMAMSTGLKFTKLTMLNIWWSYITSEAKLTYVLMLKQQILSTYWIYIYPFTWLKKKAWEVLGMRLRKTKWDRTIHG